MLPSSAGEHQRAKEAALTETDPNYNAETNTYRQIYKGHPSASAVTNSEGVTVFFAPDTHEVLGFSITEFSTYYEKHKEDDGSFGLTLPANVPANIEEEMNFDAESMRTAHAAHFRH